MSLSCLAKDTRFANRKNDTNYWGEEYEEPALPSLTWAQTKQFSKRDRPRFHRLVKNLRCNLNTEVTRQDTEKANLLLAYGYISQLEFDDFLELMTGVYKRQMEDEKIVIDLLWHGDENYPVSMTWKERSDMTESKEMRRDWFRPEYRSSPYIRRRNIRRECKLQKQAERGL